MTDILKTPPATEPVSVADMRLQLGITQDDDTARDSIIASRIKSARRWAEDYTRIAFITQTWTHYADYFPSVFDLKMNLMAVASVKYLDTDGVQQTLDSSKYLLDTVSSRLYLAYGETWPDTRDQVNAVEIEYTCGFGTADAVPDEIKDAIKFIVGHWENYQSTIEGAIRISTIPYAVEQLLNFHIDQRNRF